MQANACAFRGGEFRNSELPLVIRLRRRIGNHATLLLVQLDRAAGFLFYPTEEEHMAATQIHVMDPEAISMKSNLIGSDKGLLEVWNSVSIVAPTDSAVLIQGETGTGKELIAKAIHEKSLRRRGPYVKINCAAIPAGLLESELFGHERGAFTGAVAQTIGRFQLAHSGTLFLDEIGELPLELQPKLLRALQEQEFERLGSTRTLRVDVRIIAATNQDLAHMVAERRFRSDLFYRLNVFPISLPPLRARRDDIALLAQHFVRRFSRLMNKDVEHVTEETLAALRRYEWPGNIRELQNVIERAMIRCCGSVLSINPEDLKCASANRACEPVCTLAEAEKAHIVETLRRVGWVVGGRNGAAARLGLPRTTLLHRMQKLGIVPQSNVPVDTGREMHDRTGSAWLSARA
jgi:formate hydrogenlyase transcriptional activator